MELIEKSVEYLGMCPSDEDAMLKHIEGCGRRCYKSEHNIDYDTRSFEKFYLMLMKHGHVSAVEHSNVVVLMQLPSEDAFEMVYWSFLQSASEKLAYFRIIPLPDENEIIISANVRAWSEFLRYRWGFVLYQETCEFLTETYPIIFSHLPEYFKINEQFMEGEEWLDRERETVGSVNFRIITDDEQRENIDFFEQFDVPIFTFAAYTDRGITHEIVRHRVLSYSQESTRYVNYKSRGIQLIEFPFPEQLRERYLSTMSIVEELYNDMISAGVKPQFARNVLPHSTKTEIAMSGRLSGWRHFITLRNSKAAHPDIRFVAKYIQELLEEYTGKQFEPEEGKE
jgi:thymidylate synthase ThyX